MHIGKLCLISFVNGTLWLGLSNASDAFKNAEKLQDGLDKTEIVLLGRRADLTVIPYNFSFFSSSSAKCP